MGTMQTIEAGPKSHVRPLDVPSLPFLSLSGIFTRFVRMTERRRQRCDLLELTDEQLRDIGVTPAQARREADRPFWD